MPFHICLCKHLHYAVLHKNERRPINSNWVSFADWRSWAQTFTHAIITCYLSTLAVPAWVSGCSLAELAHHSLTPKNWGQGQASFTLHLRNQPMCQSVQLLPCALTSQALILQATTFKFDLKFNKTERFCVWFLPIVHRCFKALISVQRE